MRKKIIGKIKTTLAYFIIHKLLSPSWETLFKWWYLWSANHYYHIMVISLNLVGFFY